MKTSENLHDAIHLLQKIIRIPSFSKNEETVSDLLESYITARGFTPERIGNNLLLINKERYLQEPTILLNSHLDTVQPVETWTIDPFNPIIKENRLYGLGSNDAGASLVTMLITVLNLYDTLEYNLAFCASAEEEISGSNGISKVLKQYPHFELALVGEPTNMQPAVAEKGLMVLDCKAEGIAGHAARNEGINAIYIAMSDISWFKNYQFKKVSPFLGATKMSVTQINAGKQHNITPDKCSFVVDVRGNGCYSNEELLAIITRHTTSKIKARSTRLNSSQLEQKHPFFKYLIKNGYTPFGSPTLSDQALMPFPSIKIGPGESKRSHAANEYISLSELEDALIKYDKLLKNIKI